jgi:hypothetical protein
MIIVILKRLVQGGKVTMRNNNLLRKSIYAATTAAFVAAMGFTIDANAATLNPEGINVDSSTQTMTVTPSGGDTQVLVGFGTVKTQNNKDVLAIKSTDWDVHDVSGTSVVVDLSSIKPSKDAYVQVKGNKNDDPITIKVAKSNQQLKAEKPNYTTDNPTVTFKKAEEGESYEFRTSANSAWAPFVSGTTDLTSYIDRGATLYVRTKGSGAGAIGQSDNKVVVYPDKNSDVTSPVYDKAGDQAISFAGKEAKLSIAKRANAPKLAADYVKALITLPKSTKARILKSADNYATNVAWTENASDQKNKAEITVGSDTIKFGDTTDKILEAKTANTAAKPASRVASLKVPAITTYGTRQAPEKASTVSGGSIDGAKLVSGSSVEVTATVDSKFTPDKGGKIVLKNDNATYSFEAAVVASKSDIAKLTKFTTVKSEKSTNLSVKKEDVGKFVYVRRAGDKKAAYWPTDWVFLGTIGADTTPEGGSAGDNKETVTLTFTPSTLSLTQASPTGALTLAGAPEGAEITYSLSGVAAANITKSNESRTGVTLTWAASGTPGSVTLTASYAGDSTHKSAEVEIPITVSY